MDEYGRITERILELELEFEEAEDRGDLEELLYELKSLKEDLDDLYCSGRIDKYDYKEGKHDIKDVKRLVKMALRDLDEDEGEYLDGDEEENWGSLFEYCLEEH